MSNLPTFDPNMAAPADWAKMYRSKGIQVVPAYTPTERTNWKQPRLPWKGMQDRLVSNETFEGWYGERGTDVARENMGVVTGAASNNVFILDLDIHKSSEAKTWWQTLLEVHNSGLDLETPKQITGGGGIQLLFRAPSGWTPPTNRTPLGVDIRGRGGFAVLPPSLHSSGRHYEWAADLAPWEVSIATAREWLCVEIDQLLARDGNKVQRADVDNTNPVQGDEDNEIIPPQPASDFNSFGLRINGRENYMKDVVWAAVVNLHRDSPIQPIGASVDDAMMSAYATYERAVMSRLTGNGEKRELLEQEGRGVSLFKEKWQHAMAQWDSKVARGAQTMLVKPANVVSAISHIGSVCDADADADARPPAFADEAIALYFAQYCINDLRYVAARGKWMHYDGKRWMNDETLLALHRARFICRVVASKCDDPKVSRKAIASAKTISAVERLARADRGLAATLDQWDAQPWLLNTPAGVIDLKTGLVRAHDPIDYMTKITAVGAGGDCPIWKQHLLRVTGGDADLVAYLQRVFGYSLTGITQEHALFFAYGTGANGKSVTINTVAGILADYQCSAPIETFTASSTDRHPTELAGLQGARLVTSVETEEGRAWAESKIKTLTGGDPIAARFMRQDFFVYSPQFKLFIAGNHKPTLRSVDEAIRRRFHLIPFTVTIPPEDRDETLTERLKAEWSGILAWMVEGCLQWQRDGLCPPRAVRDATAEYLEAEDALAAWVDEDCERDARSWEKTGSLYFSWTSWADRSGEHPGSAKRFAQSLETHGFSKSRTHAGRGFVGLRIKPAQAATSWNERG